MTVREFINNNPEAIIEDNEVMEGSYYNDWISIDNALDRNILEVRENSDGTFLIIVWKKYWQIKQSVL